MWARRYTGITALSAFFWNRQNCDTLLGISGLDNGRIEGCAWSKTRVHGERTELVSQGTNEIKKYLHFECAVQIHPSFSHLIGSLE